jgi:hypothetical protein
VRNCGWMAWVGMRLRRCSSVVAATPMAATKATRSSWLHVATTSTGTGSLIGHHTRCAQNLPEHARTIGTLPSSPFDFCPPVFGRLLGEVWKWVATSSCRACDPYGVERV